MKNFNIVRLFLVFMMLLGNVYVYADDLITQQVVINVKQAGTLSTRIGYSKIDRITNLKLTGELNGTDFVFIREMLGAPSDIFEPIGEGGKLKYLDLEEAKIVSGGDFYFNWKPDYCSTKDNAISKSLFYGCAGIESLILPSSVTSIDESAFAECYSLTNLVIPSGVTSIGVGAFKGCRSLPKVNIPSSITSISRNAFEDCRSMSNIIIPTSVTRIEGYAFSGCSSLTDFVIPSSVTYIGDCAFQNCSALTSLVVPSSVTHMSNAAFQNCSALTSLVITSSTDMGYYPFKGCDQLADISYYILDSLGDYLKKGHPSFCGGYYDKSIGKIKYYINNKEITNLEIPDGVTSIGEYSFYKCRALTNLTIPASVVSIGTSAFLGCENLTSLSLPSSVTSLGWYAFKGCTGLTSIYAYMTDPQNLSFSVFEEVDKQKCILYVPKEVCQNYWLADGWGDFENIVGIDVTGIENKLCINKKKIQKIFSFDGQQLITPTKGLNIIKYNDGNVRKEIVK